MFHRFRLPKFLLIAFLSVQVFSLVPIVSQETLTDSLTSDSLDLVAQDAEKFGDPARGAIAFYQPAMNCARCHDPASKGNTLGPDLEEKREVDWKHLAESVLNPSAKIKEGFETVQVLTFDGKTTSALFIGEDDRQLKLRQLAPPNKSFEISKDDIDNWKKTKLSSMPDGLVNQLSSRQQFLDLVSYLQAIATGGSVVAAELKPANAGKIAPLPDYESHIDHAGLIKSLNDESLERGEETYRLRCASCHGTMEQEGSMPTSLRFASGKFKNGNSPYEIYQTLTHGYGMMIPQRWMVPQQKYDVIHYIRSHFLEKNPEQLFEVSPEYLASLPKGNTRGPKPVVLRPWTTMDYGSSFINTIEVSRDGSNIAQKGITVRLDDGPGGVESGKYWMMYDHDTMRLAGAWSGGFIDYEGIHFNGTHGKHPSVVGNIHFKNPTGPGWARPSDGSFADNRLIGRDQKRYGPLDRNWAQYKGMFRFGNQTIVDYTVGETRVLESPSLQFIGQEPVFQRSINLGTREHDLILQVANLATNDLVKLNKSTVLVVRKGIEKKRKANVSDFEDAGILFDGAIFGEVANGKAFEMRNKDYSISCRIKTTKDGTIFAKTQSQDEWMANGKTFFVRGGRLAFDIGWVGAVRSNKEVADGQWHDVGMTWQAKTNKVQFYVDGKQAGGGELAPKDRLRKQVVRIGFTNDNFPADSFFEGSIAKLQFFQRLLSKKEMANIESVSDDQLVASWNEIVETKMPESAGRTYDSRELEAIVFGSNRRRPANENLIAHVSGLINPKWEMMDGNLRLRISAGGPVNLVVSHTPLSDPNHAETMRDSLSGLAKPKSLQSLTRGGPPSYPKVLASRIIRGDEGQPYAVDVFERPVKNPWNAQLRLTGLDFLPDGNTMVVSAWDGSVWKVEGFAGDSNELTWRRIAAGLFQPLGIRWIDGKIYVTCRDQLAVLHDLNDDGEIDWYQCFNNDHQVTEHFHEFAMGLQTDDAGNFYYAKSARHAKTALVPHHGTLLKVSADGKQTHILAAGFRAANGVCINPDGSFVVTDQEGHWNPKNRINWVTPGGFYGNMFGYHNVTDDSDSAMDSPLCWITNEFDRSPSELLWVESEKWGPLSGSLLNFSYGYGKVYVVPFEDINGQKQGGMCEFPLPQFPTGVMRGRFHPGDGQLYCCGMFAWAGTQQQPGGLYRIRYTGKPVHLPVGLKAKVQKIEIKLSGKVDLASANDPENYSINTWDLKRTKNYGSKHYNEKRLKVFDANLKADGQTIVLTIPELKPTWGMEINYSLKKDSGEKFQGKIHNSIYRLGSEDEESSKL